jgi:transposase
MKHTKNSARRYSEGFKQQAVELLLSSNRSMNQVAHELGVTIDSIRMWKAKYLGRAGSVERDGRGVSAAELEKELRALRQENEHLRRQREILKKALGILSDGPPPSGMPSSNP